MKDFFKSLLASIIGCSIVLGIFALIIFVVVAAISFDSSGGYSLKENTVLTIKLNGILKDKVLQTNPLMDLLGEQDNETGLDDILSSIKKAKENDKIKGIYIKAEIFSASYASLKEIRDALLDFKESGKFIVAYGDTYLQGCYYLASVADKIIINPEGNLDLHGISSSHMFLKGLLDKLGIEIQVFKVGTFKSAVEPFMLDHMSDANRQQVTSYINDIWGTLTSEISSSRNISVEELNRITDSMPLLSKTDTYISNRLVDTLMYESDVKKYLTQLSGLDDVKKLNTADIDDITSVAFLNPDKSNNVVAVLYAQGDIQSGTEKTDINDVRYVKEIEKLKDNDKVKAVVFRVNSSGGSAYASEQIWKAISDLKEKKPVVVSMGDMAASGGYYISCNATKIFAEPNTLTGSIGIFGMFPNFGNLTNKVGLTYDNVKTNKFADFGQVTRPMREDEKVIMQGYIEKGYDLFLTRCSEGRGIPKDSLDKIAQGRVWTGNQALKLGLVDSLGGIKDAVAEAAKLADLKDYKINSFPQKSNFFETLLLNQKEELATRALKEYLGKDYELFTKLKQIREQDFVQARLPFDFEIR